MDVGTYSRFVIALILVLALIGVLAWAARRFMPGGMIAPTRGKRRLDIIEVASLDARRRLVLVRRDEKEHLILLGPTAETLIESGIRPLALDQTERIL
jgi:flagellar protein FliO/FliZ